MSAEVLLAAAVVGLPFLGAALVAVGRVTGGARGGYAGLGVATTALMTLMLAWLWATMPRPLVWRTDWIATAGIGFGLYIDDLSLLFALLVAVMSLLTLLFSHRYMPYDLRARGVAGSEAAYYGYILLFTGAMLGMIFAIDLIQFYIFWDLTDIASFLLIALNWRDPRARTRAVKVFLITTMGGLAVLIGVVLLGASAGTFSLPVILEARPLLAGSPVFVAALVLLLIGAVAKTAQFPLHVWLPSAMIAPTPANAFLDSAALVAAGVYLLARVQPLFGGELLWSWLVTGAGAASMVVGGLLALRATDYKIILAYSTISQYGFMFALLGLAHPKALYAALLFFAVHALIKGGLFFVVGAVTYATGTTALGTARGLWSRMPILCAIAAVLALALAGVPPLAGFWMKEAFLGASLTAQQMLLTALGVGASALTLIYMLRLLVGGFFTGDTAPERVTPLPVTMLLAPGVIALLLILLGLWPAVVGDNLVGPATQAVTGVVPDMDLSFHLNLELALSGLALALGGLAFATRGWWAARLDRLVTSTWSLDRLYNGLAAAVDWLGRRLLRLQNGLLTRYIIALILGLLGLVMSAVLPLWPDVPLPVLTGGTLPLQRGLLDWALAALLLLVAAGTVLTFVLPRHLHIVLALGVVGYLIAAIFALLLAPALGLVQVHVETLVTVLFVTVLLRIPHQIREPLVLSTRQRLTGGKVVLAALCGLAGTWLSWLAIEYVPADPIAPWFNEHAPALAHADDIVAAILVQFRALDTLGEIIVFSIAIGGVYALMRLIREAAA